MKKLSYTLEDDLSIRARYPFELFFKDWLNEHCSGIYYLSSTIYPETKQIVIDVSFEEDVDATLLMLVGLPEELKRYITQIHG